VLKLIIEDDEGRRTVVPFVRDEITIGRQEGNTIRLTERNVSRRHARLLRQNGSVFVEDLGSYNGIRINGEKVVGRTSVHDGDLVQIGDYDLAIQAEASDAPAPSRSASKVPTVPSHPVPHLNGTRGHAAPTQEMEVPTEANAPVYEEAQPLSDEEDASEPPAQGADSSRRHSTAIIRMDQVAENARQILELDPEEAPRLVVLNTEFAGQEYACIRTELRIGRTEDNDINLDHRSLSRTHAKLVREDNGEWRVIDLQSANGLTVNGESYAQPVVQHGDVIELGHVSLKFVGAGESSTFPASREDPSPAAARSGPRKGPLIAGIGLIAVALGAAGFYLLGGQPTGPSTHVEPVVDAPKPPVVPPAPGSIQEAPAEQATAQAEITGKLEAAREAIAARDFETAVEQLEALQKLPKVEAAILGDASDLLDQARAELLLKERLDLAEDALIKGQLAAARKLLQDASSTNAWADRHESLLAKVQRAAEEEERKPARAIPARGAPKAEEVKPASAEPTPQEQARKMFSEGLALFEKKQYREARTLLSRCLETDPAAARCHLMLGSTYAKLGEVDTGATHYRTFLKLAPNAPEAPKVRALLDQYEASKRGSAN